MRTDLASIPIVLAGLYLVGLAVLALAAPRAAERFLAMHASTAVAHVVELLLRLTVGVALLLYAPRMSFPTVFTAFGWVLVATTLGLLLMPWQLHRRFARWSVPRAVRHLPLLAVGSLGGGVVLLLAVARGP